MQGVDATGFMGIALEPALRLAVFLSVFTMMALAEAWAPCRKRKIGRRQRWPPHLGLMLLGTLLVRALFPLSAVALARWAETRGWGLLHAVRLPFPLAIAVSLILLDFALYLQHRLFHAIPWWWRLHRVHHADTEFDVSTGIRFHPLEMGLSMGIKGGVIVALDAPALAALLFELLLSATSLFNHANLKLPPRWDRRLRWVIVTPDMHRVHHSWHPAETDSNFGFNLPWWDRLLGTYRPQPWDGQEYMTIGLSDFREPEELRLDRLLTQPFRSAPRLACDLDTRPETREWHHQDREGPAHGKGA